MLTLNHEVSIGPKSANWTISQVQIKKKKKNQNNVLLGQIVSQRKISCAEF